MITEEERLIRRSQGYDIGFELNAKKYWINSNTWSKEKEERLFQETGLKSFREQRAKINLVFYNPEYFSINTLHLFSYLYYSNTKVQDIPQPINMSDAFHMFRNSDVSTLDLSDWDMSEVSDMSAMFYKCENLTELNLSGWDVRKVSNLRIMFAGCKKLKELNLAGWSPRRLIDFHQEDVNILNSLENIDHAEYIGFSDRMFEDCYILHQRYGLPFIPNNENLSCLYNYRMLKRIIDESQTPALNKLGVF